VDEGCGNYNTSAKVAGEQIYEERNTNPGNTPSHDEKEGCGERDDQDNEQGRDACSQPAIEIAVGSLAQITWTRSAIARSTLLALNCEEPKSSVDDIVRSFDRAIEG